MLQSVKIQKRQSEIRQALAELAAKDAPTDDETRSMETMDGEYRTNEARYRAALIAEDDERREAGAELETREDRDWQGLVGRFELRQVVLALDEGRTLDGATGEVVTELRSRGGYRGVPVPIEALEQRAGETVAAGVPDPIRTMPTADRLFANSVASQMGVRTVNVGTGAIEYPVATAGATAAWADGELANVGGPAAFTTTERSLKPENNLGVQMRISRRALKQSGDGLESAVRRDMANAIRIEVDRATFLGTGANGQPLGIIAGAGVSDYNISSTELDATLSWSALRTALVSFMIDNAVTGPNGVRLMIRPEVWDATDDLISGISISEWDRLSSKLGPIVMTTNALAAPAGDPAESTALLTTDAGGLPPAYVGMWGALDVIRDPYSDAQSGGLRITAITTMDVTIPRSSQLRILTGVR
ncbi:MAG: phage major capsid protein [Pseudomonadota bacterium]